MTHFGIISPTGSHLTTHISLDSVVYSFLNGESPENIAQNFPLLSLEQVYGAITFYLANQELVDAHLKEGEAEFQRLQESCREKNPLLYQKLKAAQNQHSASVQRTADECYELLKVDPSHPSLHFKKLGKKY